MAVSRRDHKLTGWYGSYTLRSIADCDKQLRMLAAVIRATRNSDLDRLARLRYDADLILDRRLDLAPR